MFMFFSASVVLESMLAGKAWPLEAGPEWTCERLAEPGPSKQDQSGRVSLNGSGSGELESKRQRER